MRTTLLRPPLLQDEVYKNASRLLVKSIEHTWGDHVELGAWQLAESWSNAQFETDRNSSNQGGRDTFGFLESTWWEQRDFCTGVAADTLKAAGHPLWQQYGNTCMHTAHPSP